VRAVHSIVDQLFEPPPNIEVLVDQDRPWLLHFHLVNSFPIAYRHRFRWQQFNISAVCLSLGDSGNYTEDSLGDDPVRQSIRALREAKVAW
jgi:hypothetical protein